MTILKPGRKATWTTEHGLAVQVRIVAFSGPQNRNAQVVVLTDAVDEIGGYHTGDRIYPVPRNQLAGVGQ